ncbi:MAG: hypothetical protein IJO64_05435 [Clostridia bacterium]|nr:hypothetical protein [Clostridia bacterium]
MNNDYNFGNGNENSNDFTQAMPPQQPSAQSGFQPQQPNYTQPNYNQPQYGQPQYNQPQYNQPQYNQPQQPQYQEPQPQYAPPQYQEPQPQYQQTNYDQNGYNQGYIYNQPEYNRSFNPNAPGNTAMLDDLAGGALTMGILSLVFSEIPLLNILGIIFGAKGKGKASSFASIAGQVYGKAKVGGILSKIGFILSIVTTGLYALYFMLGFLTALAG